MKFLQGLQKYFFSNYYYHFLHHFFARNYSLLSSEKLTWFSFHHTYHNQYQEVLKPIVPSAPHNDGREAPLLQMIYCPESLQTKLWMISMGKLVLHLFHTLPVDRLIGWISGILLYTKAKISQHCKMQRGGIHGHQSWTSTRTSFCWSHCDQQICI